MSLSVRNAAVSGENGAMPCDKVGVDEVPAVSVIRQEFARKGRLAHAVRSRHDVNTRTHRRALTMIAEIALDVFRGNLAFPPNFFHLFYSCGRECCPLPHLGSG